jgi:hypothetical protein
MTAIIPFGLMRLFSSAIRRFVRLSYLMTLITWFVLNTQSLAQPQGAGTDAPLDVIYLKNGHSFKGVILQEEEDTVHFRHIVRLPGKPTFILDVVFFRNEIATIERTSPENRSAWLKKLEKLDPRGEKDQARRRQLALEKEESKDGRVLWKYKDRWFTLVADLSNEELVRRVIVRLKDMFEAMHEYLGTRRTSPRTLVIRLFRSKELYQLALKERNLSVANPAVYLPERSEILVLAEWERLAEEYNKLRVKHETQLRDLERYEKQIRQHYHGQPPRAILEKINLLRSQLLRFDRENEAILDRQVQPLLQLCYHEAFHAYLDLYLFAGEAKSVPRWLNEGLAQIFETAIVETGEIRIGHVDTERLKQVQQLLRKKELPTLAELLQSESRHFLANHRFEDYISNRYFVASWALTYFLLFGVRVKESEVGNASTPQRIIQLLEKMAADGDQARVLEIWTGRPLPELEKEYREFFSRLRPDGTLRPVSASLDDKARKE